MDSLFFGGESLNKANMKKYFFIILISVFFLNGSLVFSAIPENVIGVVSWDEPLKICKASDKDILRIEKIAKIFHDLVSREEYLAAYTLMSSKIIDQLTVLEFMQEQDWLNKKYGTEQIFGLGPRPFLDIKSVEVSESPSMIFASFVSSRQKKVVLTIGIREENSQWRICYWGYAIAQDNVKAEYKAF